MKHPSWVAKLVQSLVKGHRLMDPSAWAPPNPFLLDPLFTDLWFVKILECKKRAAEKGLSFSALAQSIMGPACVRKEFRYALWGAKLREWPFEKTMEIINFYNNILASKAPSDPFAMQHAYWHSEEDLRAMATETKWIPADAAMKKIVGRLSANCPPITWGLHTDFFYHRAYELFGLYRGINKYDARFAEKDVVVIRQYGPFRAPEIWPHTSAFPIDRVTLSCVYDNLHGDFDYINHFTTTDNIPEKLKYVSIEVDGRVVEDLRTLEQVNRDIIAMAVEQDRYLKQLDGEGQKRLTVLSKYYALKELFALVDMPWYPEKAVFERWSNKPLLDISFSQLGSIEEKEAFWTELFDPTIPFTRKEFLNARAQLRERV